VAVTKTALPFLYTQLNPTNTNAGGGPEVVDLVNSGLTVLSSRGQRLAQLAEAAPTVENGLWKLEADGTMELTWHIRPGAQWHDGAPLTSGDIAFTLRVNQDPGLPVLRNQAYQLVERLDTPDDGTVIVRWKNPYIKADELFSATLGSLLPRHLLEHAYAKDSSALFDEAYFNREFVGTGPFKLRSWDAGSGLVLDVVPDYVLGRPGIEVVEVRYVTEDNALIAGVLSGSIDLMLGTQVSTDQALSIREQWQGGHVEFADFGTWVQLYPQFVDPTEPLILNLQFRRALMYAIDREVMAASIQSGLVPVADTFISPRSPYYSTIEASIVRYPYDPGRAARMMGELGYRPGSDGLLANASGHKITVGIQATTAQAIHLKAALPIETYWQQIGIATDIDTVPVQLAQDVAYRANFPGFSIQKQPTDVDAIAKLHSSEARLASRGYRGVNNARYMDPAMDVLVQRYQTTIPIPQRIQAISQIVHEVSDQLVWMGIFFDTGPALISNRLVNVGAGENGAKATWNASQWAIR
jgi:peptide/nickel transport system substrate-binding protein